MSAILVGADGVQIDSRRTVSDLPEDWARLRLVRGIVTGLDREIAAGLSIGMKPFRGVLGHTGVAMVESDPSEANGSLAGRRVLISPHVACRSCDMCRSGLRLHCRAHQILGMHELDGCLASQLAAPRNNLLVIADDLDDDVAAFGSIVAAGLQAVRQLTIEGKPYITVLGDGPVGLCCAQLMSRLNASVRVIGRHLHKLAVCERWGVKHRVLDSIGRRADQDIVVDCTGRPDGLDVALQLVRPRGQILSKSLAASRGDGRLVDMKPLVTGEVTLLGSGFGPMSEALSLLARREIDVLGLIDRRCRLADAASAFAPTSGASPLSVLIEP